MPTSGGEPPCVHARTRAGLTWSTHSTKVRLASKIESEYRNAKTLPAALLAQQKGGAGPARPAGPQAAGAAAGPQRKLIEGACTPAYSAVRVLELTTVPSLQVRWGRPSRHSGACFCCHCAQLVCADLTIRRAAHKPSRPPVVPRPSRTPSRPSSPRLSFGGAKRARSSPTITRPGSSCASSPATWAGCVRRRSSRATSGSRRVQETGSSRCAAAPQALLAGCLRFAQSGADRSSADLGLGVWRAQALAHGSHLDRARPRRLAAASLPLLVRRGQGMSTDSGDERPQP